MDRLYQWDRHGMDGCQGIIYLVSHCSMTDVPYLHVKRGVMKHSITWLAQSVPCLDTCRFGKFRIWPDPFRRVLN